MGEPKIKAQVIKAQTMTDGALRIYLDVFNSDDMSIAYLTLLAKDQAVIEFEPTEHDPGKPASKKTGIKTTL